MNILCINICQRPDWVIVLWTKIAPENNPIWFFESQMRVAPGRSSNDSSNHLISQRVTSLHVPGDSTLLWGLSNTVLLCCGDCSILKYSLPSLFLSPHPCSSMVPLQSIPSPSPGQEGVYQQISPTVAFHELVFTTTCSKRLTILKDHQNPFV